MKHPKDPFLPYHMEAAKRPEVPKVLLLRGLESLEACGDGIVAKDYGWITQ